MVTRGSAVYEGMWSDPAYGTLSYLALVIGWYVVAADADYQRSQSGAGLAEWIHTLPRVTHHAVDIQREQKDGRYGKLSRAIRRAGLDG